MVGLEGASDEKNAPHGCIPNRENSKPEVSLYPHLLSFQKQTLQTYGQGDIMFPCRPTV
jgi:hypothetical protein